MNSRIAIAGVLALGLLVTVGAFGYQVTRQFMRYQATENLYQDIFQSAYQRSSPDIMRTDIERLRKATDSYGGDRLEGMLVDRLAYKVWFVPDEANAALSEIFERTPRLSESPDLCPFVQSSSYMLTWSYQSAVLPEMVERDADVVIARRPEVRTSVRNLQAYTRLMNDDLDGVRELADKELSQRNGIAEARAFSLSCHVILGDYEQAAQYADSFKRGLVGDINIQMTYEDLLIQQRRFEEARKVAEKIMDGRAGNELAVSLAVPLYYLNGPEDKQTRSALKDMSQSGRNPMSVAGAEAWVAARLFEVTGEERFAVRLRSLASQNPKDFDVWAAQADCLMNRSMWLQDGGMIRFWEQPDSSDGAKLATQTNGMARIEGERFDGSLASGFAKRAAANASTEMQQLQCQIYLARGVLYRGDGALSAADKEEILSHLRLSLCAEGPDAGKVMDRVPDYDMLLTDRRFQQLRRDDPAFSERVHREVAAYVQRRMDFFQPALDNGEKARQEYLAHLRPARTD